MTSHIRTTLFFLLSAVIGKAYAQQTLEGTSAPLSPAESRYHTANPDIKLITDNVLYDHPAYTHWHEHQDTLPPKGSAIIYTTASAADTPGDFIPYEGHGSNDLRIGAHGIYATPKSGTLSGSMQYAEGKHRGIGWSGMRMPELYLPYISTDSCGGDFKYNSYVVKGNYGFSLGKWNLGAKASFYGEQAYRLTDPRALNNTTWLRFGAGATYPIGKGLLMMDAGYGRNKQHTQLRYWRPGQQDRFFVCYGFGLYDTRQSGVSFGKSRMYYMDEYQARLQYLSDTSRPLQLHAAIGFNHDYMQTEESDIYNLYESKTNILTPQLTLTYDICPSWTFQLMANGMMWTRKGYENIIEEYLIDDQNYIYDFRTMDTQQNYSHNINQWAFILCATKRWDISELTLQGGLTLHEDTEKYKIGNYRTQVKTSTPHVKANSAWHLKNNDMSISLCYARQKTGSHTYDVYLQNQDIPHLDFQHTFAPYAFKTANLHQVALNLNWEHRFKKLTAGIDGKLGITNGHRCEDVVYTQKIGFASTAPMISPQPNKHQEKWGSVSLYVKF